MFHDFGQQFEQEELLEKIAEEACAIPDTMRDAKFGVDQWKRIMYHTLFIKPGLDNPKGGWDMVSQNSVEDMHKSRPAASLVAQFRAYRVPDKFGLSIKDFLSMPKWISDVILTDARLQHQQELKQISSLENTIGKDEEKARK